jgi:hypothetical protein
VTRRRAVVVGLVVGTVLFGVGAVTNAGDWCLYLSVFCYGGLLWLGHRPSG